MSWESEGFAASQRDPRERILEAALSLFAEKGFDAVTLRAIGARVGLHNSSLFHHFRSKAEMAQVVFDRVLARVLPILEPLAEDDRPDLERFLAVLQTTRNLFGLLLFEPSYGLGTSYPGSPTQAPEIRRRERREDLAAGRELATSIEPLSPKSRSRSRAVVAERARSMRHLRALPTTGGDPSPGWIDTPALAIRMSANLSGGCNLTELRLTTALRCGKVSVMHALATLRFWWWTAL